MRPLVRSSLLLGCLAAGAGAAEPAAEPVPLPEAQRQFVRWDGAIRNGVLYNAAWSGEGERLAFDWVGEDGKVVTRVLDCETGTLTDSESKGKEWATGADRQRARASWKVPGRTLSSSRAGATSPDKRWKVTVEGSQLMLTSTRGEGPARRLASCEGETGWVGKPSWSPDGRHFAIWLHRKAKPRELSVREAATGKVTTLRYPVAGDPVDVLRAWVFSVSTGEAFPVPEELIGPTYLTERLDWTADSTRLRTDYVRRGFTGFGVLEFDTRTRGWRKVLEESDPKFSYVFGLRFRHDLDAETCLWISERTGWSHLYRMDLRTGQVLNAVTSGAWVMRRIVRVDPAGGQALIEAVGLHPGENPYQAHLCRVNLDGTGFTDLTPGDAHHEVSLSPSGRHFVDTASRPDLPPTFSVRRTADGATVAVLGAADISRSAAAGWTPPIRFRTKDRDGKFDIWGLIHRPKPFDPAKRYPVLERLYAGPHDSFTPAGFAPWWEDAIREPNLNGFYVVQIDGLGTRNRGREFHQRCWQDLRDAGLPDRIAWMRAAARAEPQMDLARVGVFGGSAGGQSTVFALLDHGDFYRAGAADCGCYDNRVDKLWWNEQWLGWPVNASYDRNRCANFAGLLNRPLLMTVGEVDTNVDPRSSAELRDAFVAAGKGHLVDFRVVPGAGHGAGEQDDVRQVRLGFFLRHLGGPLPR